VPQAARPRHGLTKFQLALSSIDTVSSMDSVKPHFRVIEGSRYEIEQELVRLLLTSHPTPKEELERLMSLLKPGLSDLKLVTSADPASEKTESPGSPR